MTRLIVSICSAMASWPFAAFAADAVPENPVTVPAGFEVLRPQVAGRDAVPTNFSSGSIICLEDGRVLNVYDNRGKLEICFSSDGGGNWSSPDAIDPPADNVRFGRPSALQVRDGTIWLLAYGFVRWSPDPAQAQSDLWALRSTDNGKSWEPPFQIWSGYTGMTQGAIETSAGHIVLPFCYLGPQAELPAIRFVGGCVVSTDGGRSWHFRGGLEVPPDADRRMRSRVHGGTLEPSVVQLRDGRLWMLMRTVTGYLWESFSADGARSWSPPRKTKISCGGPVFVTRLQSGRLLLIWNEADWSQAANWAGWPNGYARASMALSDDEGATWQPAICYAEGGKRTVHSVVAEYAPGQLLITMWERQIFLRTSEDRLLPSR